MMSLSKSPVVVARLECGCEGDRSALSRAEVVDDVDLRLPLVVVVIAVICDAPATAVRAELDELVDGRACGRPSSVRPFDACGRRAISGSLADLHNDG